MGEFILLKIATLVLAGALVESANRSVFVPRAYTSHDYANSRQNPIRFNSYQDCTRTTIDQVRLPIAWR